MYVSSYTLLLTDVFENFTNKCMETDELDPWPFSICTWISMVSMCVKKTEIKLELFTDFDILFMVEKWIRGGICHAIQRYTKANIKYMKNYDKYKESSYIQYLYANNLYGWAVLFT